MTAFIGVQLTLFVVLTALNIFNIHVRKKNFFIILYFEHNFLCSSTLHLLTNIIVSKVSTGKMLTQERRAVIICYLQKEFNLTHIFIYFQILCISQNIKCNFIISRHEEPEVVFFFWENNWVPLVSKLYIMILSK